MSGRGAKTLSLLLFLFIATNLLFLAAQAYRYRTRGTAVRQARGATPGLPAEPSNLLRDRIADLRARIDAERSHAYAPGSMTPARFSGMAAAELQAAGLTVLHMSSATVAPSGRPLERAGVGSRCRFRVNGTPIELVHYLRKAASGSKYRSIDSLDIAVEGERLFVNLSVGYLDGRPGLAEAPGGGPAPRPLTSANPLQGTLGANGALPVSARRQKSRSRDEPGMSEERVASIFAVSRLPKAPHLPSPAERGIPVGAVVDRGKAGVSSEETSAADRAETRDLRYLARATAATGRELFLFEDRVVRRVYLLEVGGTDGELRLAGIDGDVFILEKGTRRFRVQRR